MLGLLQYILTLPAQEKHHAHTRHLNGLTRSTLKVDTASYSRRERKMGGATRGGTTEAMSRDQLQRARTWTGKLISQK
ncbi:unnamed protein product [Ascophyllum nodosum]